MAQNPNASKKNDPVQNRPLGYGWALVWIVSLIIIGSKTALLYDQGYPSITLGRNTALEFLFALIILGSYYYCHTLSRHILRAAAKTLIAGLGILVAVGTIGAYVLFHLTGHLPRLQQLDGLTWGIIGPSILPMVLGQKYAILFALVGFVLTILVVSRLLRSPNAKPYLIAAVGAMLFVVGSFIMSYALSDGNSRPDPPLFLALSLFENDMDGQIGSLNIIAEKHYSHDLREKLSKTTGINPRYAQLIPRFNGKNIVLLLMESVRAKDLPIYGGPADMPHLMALKDQTIVLENLYSQDIRTSKSYAAFDMGQFGLPSWDSYPSKMPRKFGHLSLVQALKTLGYHTSCYNNISGDYDNYKEYQLYRGYDRVWYGEDINPGSSDFDDSKLLAIMDKQLATLNRPFYIQAWPIGTHHPYGSDYWSDKTAWLAKHPEGIKHGGSDDYRRYLQSLNDLDQFLAALIHLLKKHDHYENTVLVAIGDHGEAFGEHHRKNVFHGNNLYEESVHVAGFIHSPLISRPIREAGFFSHKDLAASINHIADGKTYILNQARSIFNDYEHELPVYLFNSWTGYRGIIYKGMKLRMRNKPGARIYFGKVAAIRVNPRVEDLPAINSKDYGDHLGLLNHWHNAMNVLTVRLLETPETAQFDETFRVYCDDGQGFREGLKNRISLEEGANHLIIAPNKQCQSIRITPLEKSSVDADDEILFRLEFVEIETDQGVLTSEDLTIKRLHNMKVIDNYYFKLTGERPSVEYQLPDKDTFLHKLTIQVDYPEATAS